MSRIPVNELKDGDPVEQVFVVRECQFNVTKKGQPYARLQLGDYSGIIAGIYWAVPDAAAALLRASRFVRVKGFVRVYQGALQVNVETLTEAPLETVDVGDFLPRADIDIDERFARLKKIMGQVENPHLAALVKAFFADEALCGKLKKAPAASMMHHAYVGGLLEHTTSMAEAALKLSEHYTDLNTELLLVGVLIHDIGKTEEFAYETDIDYSDAGRLVGHVAIGLSLLERLASEIEAFPKALLDVLRHFILSHHGIAEFGAIRRPATAEALALHYLDNLDAKLAAFYKATSEPATPGNNWTQFQRMFDGMLYKGDVFAAEPVESEEEENETAPDKPEGPSLF